MKRLTLMFTGLLIFTATLVAQDEPLATKRVHHVTLPLQVSNTVGGTYVDSYIVQVKKGANLHVHVENESEHSKFSFDTVLAGTEKRFGRDLSENSWSGVAPSTGDYEIRLIAFPSARYNLRVHLARDCEEELNVNRQSRRQSRSRRVSDE
ncbi:MAG TPA: hypothetical protein VJV03_14750 [Pyrinomonadaceae bacterium]|nr:hypothetical protein [Pyrinomonadaceae bacterium]